MKRPEKTAAVKLGACVVLLLAFCSAAGCASKISTKLTSPVAYGSEEGRQHAEAVLREIEDRNQKVESGPEWRGRAYSHFLIRPLSSVGEDEYPKYSRYLDNGSVYIIVHPAYYTFFHDNDLFGNDATEVAEQNAVDRFVGDAAYSSKGRLIRAQEKMLRDFLEYMSTEKKLVILILPRDYRHFGAYKFRKGRDEYMRYINDVTNESDSVLYLYSRKPNRGTLNEKDRRTLLKFLYAIKAKEILFGGGYIGRCLEDFYKDVEQYYSEERIFLVPEITAISPADVSSSVASDMLKEDGTLDIARLSDNIRMNVLGNQNVVPKIRNLVIDGPRNTP